MCFSCSEAPVDYGMTHCDRCSASVGDYGEWWEQENREQLLGRLDYVAGLAVKLGGGTYREVHRELTKALGVRRRQDASLDQLYEAMEFAEDWIARLRRRTGQP
jgi:hypothetical protein